MDGLEGARHTVFPLWPLPVNSPQVHKNCSDVPMSRLKGPQGNGAGWTQHLQEFDRIKECPSQSQRLWAKSRVTGVIQRVG